jgi:hypothetical protein
MKAAEIVNLWKPLLEYAFPVSAYPRSEDLEMVAKALEDEGPPQAHAPEK